MDYFGGITGDYLGFEEGIYGWTMQYGSIFENIYISFSIFALLIVNFIYLPAILSVLIIELSHISRISAIAYLYFSILLSLISLSLTVLPSSLLLLIASKHFCISYIDFSFKQSIIYTPAYNTPNYELLEYEGMHGWCLLDLCIFDYSK